MKYWKHHSDLWNDEGVARLVGKGGVEGLAAWGVLTRVLDVIAAEMDWTEKCSVSYSVTRWGELLSVPSSHVRHRLEKLLVIGWVVVESNGTEIKVEARKLLEWRDEYSEKSRHRRDQEQQSFACDSRQETREQQLPLREPPAPPEFVDAFRQFGRLDKTAVDSLWNILQGQQSDCSPKEVIDYLRQRVTDGHAQHPARWLRTVIPRSADDFPEFCRCHRAASRDLQRSKEREALERRAQSLCDSLSASEREELKAKVKTKLLRVWPEGREPGNQGSWDQASHEFMIEELL